jgi:hypothetical protein
MISSRYVIWRWANLGFGAMFKAPGIHRDLISSLGKSGHLITNPPFRRLQKSPFAIDLVAEDQRISED